MKRFALTVLLALTLAGCSNLPRTVEVPVGVPCPPPPKVTRPTLAISTLVPDSRPDEVIRAYAVSLEQVAGYAAQLELLLDGYRESSPRPSAK